MSFGGKCTNASSWLTGLRRATEARQARLGSATDRGDRVAPGRRSGWVNYADAQANSGGGLEVDQESNHRSDAVKRGDRGERSRKVEPALSVQTPQRHVRQHARLSELCGSERV